MAALIDTSIWIDFLRPSSLLTLKLFVAPFVLDPDAHLAEPVTFEVLRHATAVEAVRGPTEKSHARSLLGERACSELNAYK